MYLLFAYGFNSTHMKQFNTSVAYLGLNHTGSYDFWNVPLIWQSYDQSAWFATTGPFQLFL